VELGAQAGKLGCDCSGGVSVGGRCGKARCESYGEGPTYSSAVSATCDSRDSMPEHSVSSERDIWPSWVLGDRLSEMALWRSRRESLMWSARRNSCGGLVVDMAAGVEMEMEMEMGTPGKRRGWPWSPLRERTKSEDGGRVERDG
jgi:hypothetical protein